MCPGIQQFGNNRTRVMCPGIHLFDNNHVMCPGTQQFDNNRAHVRCPGILKMCLDIPQLDNNIKCA